MGRVLLALLACVAVALPAQAADAKPKRKHPTSCKKKKAKRGKHRRRRCARKRKVAARKHQVPKTTAPGALPAPAAPSPGGSAPTPPLGRYLSVSGKEFSLQLSRPALAAGAVTLEFRNVGEDPHDLVLSPDGSHAPLASFGETASGGIVTQSLTLPAGRYYLYCSLPNHESLGMSAHLRVQ